MITAWLLTGWLFLQPAQAAEPAPVIRHYAPKISLRMSNGYQMNQGTLKGGALTLGGLNLSYAQALDSRWAVGGGYRVDFDYAAGNLIFNGIQLFTRRYFRGGAARVTTENERMMSESLDTWAFYAGPQIGFTGYYFGLNPRDKNQTDMLEGTYFSIEATGGVDYRLSRNLELNAEAALGLMSFAHSDPRYKMQGFLFLAGISYLW